jgi:hypothetical protein
MKTSRLLLMSLLSLGIMATSCKKAEEEVKDKIQEKQEEPAEGATLSPNMFNTDGYDGMLAGIKTVTEQNTGPIATDITLGTAVAYFTNTRGDFSNFVAGGTITCESKELTKQDNNSYVYTPATTDVTGISFSGATDWEVSGAGNVKAFTAEVRDFPKVPKIDSETSLTAGSEYVFKASDLRGSDTVLFVIASGSKTLIKGSLWDNGKSSVTFTADETKDLAKATGTALFQVAAVKFEDIKNPNGTNAIYLGINESVKSSMGDVK